MVSLPIERCRYAFAQWYPFSHEPIEINIEFRTRNVEILRDTNATLSFDIPYSVFDIQNSLKEDGIDRSLLSHMVSLWVQPNRQQFVAFNCALRRDKLEGSEAAQSWELVAVSCVPRRNELDGSGTVSG